jgi:GNAT superfamily N-acetyltransferase
VRILESGYKIRSPRFEELTLLSRIEKSAASLFLDTPYSFLVNAEPLPLDFVRERFQAGQVWVAVDQHDAVIGYAVTREVDDTIYLQQIDVHPEHGQKGIGYALVDTVCSWAKRHSYRVMSLSTFRDIPWNAPFYSKFGFRILDESELTTGFQQIRLKEFEAELPISERVIMHRKLEPSNNPAAPKRI